MINEQHLRDAIGILRAVRNLRRTRATLIQSAIEVHGWKGPLISGIEQDHWPAEIKDYLRTNAREISKGLDDAMTCWRKSGKRHHTFLRELHSGKYNVEGSRY